jgi:hypothetical protein
VQYGYYRKNAITWQQEISQKCDDMWILRCYDLGNGGFHGWYNDQPGDVMGAIDAALEMLATEPGELTELPHYQELRGACKGLDEVVVDLEDGRHFRILAFRGPSRRDCTLLYGFEKHDNTIYGRACWAANRRKEGIERDGSRAPECDFP